LARKDNSEIVSYTVRWREDGEDGVRRQPRKSFSVSKCGSLDRALKAATAFLAGAREAVKVDGSVARPDTAEAMTIEEGFREWLSLHGPDLSESYADKAVRLWDREIATRSIARVRLGQISRDPTIITRFQDALVAEGIGRSKRREILKLLRAVLRWIRSRHPNALTVELNGLIQLPKQSRKRLPYATDAIGLERIIEAVLKRPARDDLLPLRDAAFVAAMGFTIAARPSEWRRSVTWADLYDSTVELQRASDEDPEDIEGLKTGARAALLLPSARDRISTYRAALEDRFGPQPDNGLVFQVLDEDGPVWVPGGDGEPVPLAMNDDAYNRWNARVWRPARKVAAQAPDVPQGIARMTFYDCRHTAISIALHSTLVMSPHGMNLHPLAGWAGHDIETLQRYYSHLIARYHGQPPIDLEAECQRARAAVEANPFDPDERAGPQREAQRRRRERVASSVRAPEPQRQSIEWGYGYCG
jgi:integrase